MDTESGLESQKKTQTNKYAYSCAVLASMTSTILGYNIGVMSGAADYIQKDLQISDVHLEFLLGVLNVYALLGSAAAGRTSDLIGRRLTLVLTGAIFFVGAILMGLASNYPFLMFGRFVAGIGVGYAMVIAPVYTAEISPASSRGFLTSLAEVFINVGILLGYVSNYAFSSLPISVNWRLMLGIAAIPSFILALGVLSMPESPRWLVMQGRLVDAKEVLLRTSDSEEEAQEQLDDIKEAAGIPKECNSDIHRVEKKTTQGSGAWKELFLHPTPAVRHIIIAGVGIHFFQQASGIDSVVLYSPKIFEKAGIQQNSKILFMTVAVGFIKTVAILVATIYLNKFGRRPLILFSMGGMVISMLLLGTGLSIIDHSNPTIPLVVALCVIMVFLFVASFSMGMGPIVWVYCSEIFPLRLRAQGVSMVVGVNRLTSGIVSMTFLSLYKAITIGGAFLLYGCVAVIAWIFFFSMLPETKGKKLEEVEELFGKG